MQCKDTNQCVTLMLRFIACKNLSCWIYKRLFVADPNKRLGGGPTDGKEIRDHPWFAGVDWNMIANKQIKPPFKPKLRSETDDSHIDPCFTQLKVGDSPES